MTGLAKVQAKDISNPTVYTFSTHDDDDDDDDELYSCVDVFR